VQQLDLGPSPDDQVRPTARALDRQGIDTDYLEVVREVVVADAGEHVECDRTRLATAVAHAVEAQELKHRGLGVEPGEPVEWDDMEVGQVGNQTRLAVPGLDVQPKGAPH